MATGNDRAEFDVNLPAISADDFSRLVDYSEDERHGDRQSILRDPSAVLGKSSFVVGAGVTVSAGAGAGSTKMFSVSGATTREAAALMAREEAATPSGEIGTWTAASSGFASVPFEDDGSSTYQVGLRHNDYPGDVTHKSDGEYFYDRMVNGIGEIAQATALSEHSGAGNGLRVTFASSAVQPWSDVAQGRPVTVWLVDPVTASAEAIYTGTLESNGTLTWVDMPHYLGQSAGGYSTTGADYRVMVHGISVTKKATLNLMTQTTGGGVIRIYCLLAEYDAATAVFDHSVQIVVPSLQSVADRLGINLRALVRSGAYLGDYQTTREWNDPTNVTVNTAVDPVTFTFADPFTAPSEAWIAAGSAGAELAIDIANSFSSLVATLAKSEASGDYYIAVERDALNKLRMVVIDQASWTDIHEQFLLRIYAFNFTTGTGAVASEAARNLMDRRGVFPSSVFGPNTDSDGKAITIDEVYAPASTIGFRLRNVAGGGFAVEKVCELTVGSQEVALKLGQPVGSDLATNDFARVVFGGSNDWELRASYDGTDRAVAWRRGGIEGMRLQHLGGVADGSTVVTKIRDLQLLGSGGKDNWRQLDIWAGYGDTAERSSAPQVVATSAEIVVEDSVTLDDLLSGADWSRPAYDVDVGTIFRFRAAGEVVSVNGTPDVSIYAKAAGTAWASGVTIAASAGLEFLLEADVVAHVATGRIIVHPRWGDAGGGTTPLGAAPLGVNMAGLTSIAWDSATALAFQLQAQWSAAHADNIVRCNYASLERLDSGNLWAKNVTAGGSQRWYCAVSNGKKINWQIAPPTGSAQNVEIKAVRVRARLNSAASGDKITLRLHTYSLPASGAGAISSAIALTGGTGADYVDVTSGTFAWYTLTPTTPVVTSRLARALVQAETVHASGAGSIPGFEIDGVEYQTTGREILW